MSAELTSRSIAVTGAASGIGRAFARAYAARSAAVAVCDLDVGRARETVDEINGEGGRAIALGMDVTDRSSVREGLQTAVAEFGRLDVMVNNAGISGDVPFLDSRVDQWTRQLRVNGLGTLIGMQEAARLMMPAGTGRIVNVTSVAARRSSATFAPYAASKATVSSLIQSGARALAPHGITVMGIAPGIVDTGLWNEVDPDPQHRAERLAQYAAGILAGRVATPDDLVGTAVFLASPASDYLTGQVIMADGGMVLV